ncbi:LAGLIDADG family homing endonuclease [Bacillus dakarensis]|uniref:LAGLIDADG family homing endonuclease n=1 Tax=Robertmurraya dakarensis TaxID=1926278 RepID=UPI000981CB8E|nr:LAGLIDADG family homing endonuclease [Bacillus dakarensis]
MKNWEAAYLAGIIDGEGTVTLTRMHENEYRRPCITIASTDKELLDYIQTLTGGTITKKKNYKPDIHKNSYSLMIKKKDTVFYLLRKISNFLRIEKKKQRALLILENYEKVTPRNGKYSHDLLQKKLAFEEQFFQI